MEANRTYKVCTAKETRNKMKRQVWEKIFANDTTDKSFISKIKLIELNNKNQDPVK